jgi:hypothetical protein
MKPPPENSNITSQEHAAVVNEEDVTFEFQLLRWFGSDSRTTATRVREGILKMHKVLTDPLEIISFVNDLYTQDNTKRWVPRYQNVPTHNYEGFIVKPRIGHVGHVIHIDCEANFQILSMSGMVRYIFHELSRQVLELRYFEWDSTGHLPNFKRVIIDHARKDCNLTLSLPSSWTHFVDSFVRLISERLSMPTLHFDRHMDIYQ